MSHPASLRSFRPLQAVLLVLTFVTGMVDAVTYLELGHVFAANMTGNVILLGFALVGAGQVSVGGSLVALGVFVVGAAVSGRLARVLERTGQRWVVTMLGVETVVMAAAALSAIFRATTGDYPIVGLLALVMGMRTFTVRRIGITDFNTTVLTSTLAGLAAHTQEPGATFRGAGIRLAAVAAMLFGAASGALLLAVAGAPGVLTATAALVLVSTLAYTATLRTAYGHLD